MTRIAPVVLALTLWFGVGLSAQQLGQSLLRPALEREAIRMASTLAAHDPSSTDFNTHAAQIERSDDWDAVRRLKDGTRVRVTTRQDRRLNGKLTTVSEDTVQMVVRFGRKQTLLRDDIREVRLRHPLHRYVFLGVLAGGVTGYVAGRISNRGCVDCLPAALSAMTFGFLGGSGGALVGKMVDAPGPLVYALAKP